MSASTVTLDKVYFETILRRAQFHTSGIDFTTPLNLATVTIPKPDHDSLLNIAREYANLRRNLYKGGVTDETLAILINDDGQTQEPVTGRTTATDVDGISETDAYLSQNLPSSTQTPTTSRIGRQNFTYGRNDNYGHRNGGNGSNDYNTLSNTFDDLSTIPDGQADVFFEADNAYVEQGRRPYYAKNAKRTVQLCNLPETVTHADIVDVVRGGMLLDVYLRSNDRTVAVSFVEEDDAQAFFHHVKRNDLYIRGKRAEIRWHERQFILPGHVANKIALGATRNLVIRNSNPRHTEKCIRDDLEHIHNLVVIRVTFKGQNVHVNTNSVHNAMFARTCMMSRTTYKGSKIDWDTDECAGPLPKSPPIRRRDNNPPKKQSTPLNRFALLNIDGGEDGSEDDSLDDDHDQSGGVAYQTPFSAKSASVAV